MNNKLKGLTQYREKRSEEKRDNVKKATRELFDLNELVNVNSVARRANVSRRYLYNHDDLMNLIKNMKGPSLARNQKKVSNFKASEKSNVAQLRLIKIQYQKLLKENKDLKGEVRTLQAYIDDLTMRK